MKEHLLKRALPFMLTFAVGAGVGGFFQFFTSRASGWLAAKRHTYSYAGRRGCGQRFRRASAPESKPHVINFNPGAYVSPSVMMLADKYGANPARVRVVLGHDGKVHEVEYPKSWPRELGEAAEHAARQIKFTPATLDGAPTTVTEEVKIHFSFR